MAVLRRLISRVQISQGCWCSFQDSAPGGETDADVQAASLDYVILTVG